jgi:hypothetical protein
VLLARLGLREDDLVVTLDALAMLRQVELAALLGRRRAGASVTPSRCSCETRSSPGLYLDAESAVTNRSPLGQPDLVVTGAALGALVQLVALAGIVPNVADAVLDDAVAIWLVPQQLLLALLALGVLGDVELVVLIALRVATYADSDGLTRCSCRRRCQRERD